MRKDDKVKVYDRPGSMDRYTILVRRKDSRLSDMYFCGVNPEGLSGWCGDYDPYEHGRWHLGKRVEMDSLPEAVRELAIRLGKEAGHDIG